MVHLTQEGFTASGGEIADISLKPFKETFKYISCVFGLIWLQNFHHYIAFNLGSTFYILLSRIETNSVTSLFKSEPKKQLKSPLLTTSI